MTYNNNWIGIVAFIALLAGMAIAGCSKQDSATDTASGASAPRTPQANSPGNGMSDDNRPGNHMPNNSAPGNHGPGNGMSSNGRSGMGGDR